MRREQSGGKATAYGEHDEQRLHCENGMAPIVTRNRTIVSLHGHYPSAQSLRHTPAKHVTSFEPGASTPAP